MDNTQGRISGGSTPPPPRNFHIFLKSEGKEVERERRDGGGYLLTYFLELRYFQGGLEIFFGGGGVVEKFFLGGGVEIFSVGLRNFRGFKNFFKRD